MRSKLSRILGVAVLAAGVSSAISSPARGQMGAMPGGGGSLGGYGGRTITSYYSTGASGTAYIPYGSGGMGGGFVPYSGGGGGLGVISRGPRRVPETQLGGSSMMMYGFVDRGGMGSRAQSRISAPFIYPGAMGGGMPAKGMPRRNNAGVVPPSLASPFREPPGFAGSSMSMP